MAQRELREGARRRFNYWLRVGSAFAAVILFLGTLTAYSAYDNEEEFGVTLFSKLHTLLLVLISLIVPTMTADCISREKREGSLGLLFLTKLTPMGIVVGKGLVQILRALTLWLAVLPILTIPFLTGGVLWNDAVFAIALEFCAMVLCLAAGLLASSMTDKRAAAFCLALAIAVGLMTLLNCEVKSILSPSIYVIYEGLGIISDADGWPPRWQADVILETLPASLFLLLLALGLAAWFVQRYLQDRPPSLRTENLVRQYCTPLFQAAFRRKMQRSLEKNPIIWLQQYSWKARLTKWGLCLTVIIYECWAAADENLGRIEDAQVLPLLVLAGFYTFASVNSFWEEKNSGALELILVTPLSVNQIVSGRVLGLWKQFLPATLLVALTYFTGLRGFWRDDSYDPMQVFLPAWCVLNGYIWLPFFGTYFALRVKNLIVAAILTWVVLIFAPITGIGLFGILSYGLGKPESAWFIVAGVLFGYVPFVAQTCFLLRHCLSRRIYSF